MCVTRQALLLPIPVAIAAVVGASTTLLAQETDPRLGVWKLVSDAPAPALHIMTYEPYGEGGLQVAFESTSRDGQESEWSYVTMLDGVFRPVTGHEGNETAVELLDDRTHRITLKRNGRVRQITISVLSEDGNTINNEYRRIEDDGTERVLHAAYERVSGMVNR